MRLLKSEKGVIKLKITVENFLEMISLESKEIEKFKMNHASILKNEILDYSDTFPIGHDCVFFDRNKYSINEIKEKGQQALIILTNRELHITNELCVNRNTIDIWFGVMEYARKQMKNLSGIAVTGSVGKTTTKEMIYQVLSQESETAKNPGSSNGKYGFARGFSKVTPDTKYFVMEMGLSHPRPVFEPISRALYPDICVITNIGTAHIENFEDQDEILKYKLYCAKYMPKESGCLLINGDDKILMGHSYEFKTATYGIENSNVDYWAKDIVCTAKTVDFSVLYRGGKELKFHLNIPGRHNVYAALCAIAVADLKGISYEKIHRGLSLYQTSGLRQNIVYVNGQKRIIDCFNANKESMISAIDMLSLMDVKDNGRKVCVFGDMLALGKHTEEHHSCIGKYIAEKEIDVLITYGRYARYAANAAIKMGRKQVYSFLEKEDICQFLQCYLNSNDVVLFKASHDTHMDEIINGLDFKIKSAAAGLVKITETGYEEILKQDCDTQRQIAGLTKLMTATIAYDSGKLADYAVVDPSTWSLKTDNENDHVGMKLCDLIYAVIFRQENEIARTIAKIVAGNPAGFVKLMNKKAQEIGMSHTSFSNVIGLDADMNYSTVNDLLALLIYMNKFTFFQELFREGKHTIICDNGRELSVSNKNQVELKGRTIFYKRGHSGRGLECMAFIYDYDDEKYAGVILGSSDQEGDDLKTLCEYQHRREKINEKQVGILIGGTDLTGYYHSLNQAESILEDYEKEYNCHLFIVSKIGQWYYFDGPMKQIRDVSWERSEYAHPILFSPQILENAGSSTLIVVEDKNNRKYLHIDYFISFLPQNSAENMFLKSFVKTKVNR